MPTRTPPAPPRSDASAKAMLKTRSAFTPMAYAQEQATTEEEEEAKPEVEFQEVVVTGSRIRRTEFNSPAPVSVITTERAQLAGLLSTEEILRGQLGLAEIQVVQE